MQLTAQIWAVIHGMMLGSLFLLAYAGGLAELINLGSEWATEPGEVWAVIHGMMLGALFLLAYAGGLAELINLGSKWSTEAGIAKRERRLSSAPGLWLCGLAHGHHRHLDRVPLVTGETAGGR